MSLKQAIIDRGENVFDRGYMNVISHIKSLEQLREVWFKANKLVHKPCNKIITEMQKFQAHPLGNILLSH